MPKLFSRLCSASSATFAGFFIVIAAGISFGHWFWVQQVQAVSGQVANPDFPFMAHMLTLLRCTLAVTAAYALVHMVISLVCRRRFSSLLTAIAFTPLCVVNLGYRPWQALFLAFLLLMLLSLYCLRVDGCRRLLRACAADGIALAALLGIHLVCTTAFSPLTADMPLLSVQGLVTEEIPVVAPLYRQYVNAGQYSFSSMDYSEWAAVMHPPITLNSTLMQLVALVWELPPISIEAFHKILNTILFSLIVGGSFGCYLFLKYALNIRSLIAFAGGALFFICGGAPMFSGMFTYDGGVLIASFAVFPYALLFISLAFRKEEYAYAVLAGLALASQLFFYSPHPEGTIYSIAFFTLFTLFLCRFNTAGRWGYRQKFFASGIALGTFFLLTAYALLPVIADTVAGRMHTFAHTGDIGAVKIKSYIYYLCIFPVAAYILFRMRQRINPAGKAMLALALFLFLLFTASSLHAFNMFVVSVLHIGLHLGGVPWRVGLYFFFSLLCLAALCVDYAAGYAQTRWGYKSKAVAVAAAIILFMLFPHEFIRDASRTDNPGRCRYYVTLQSLLVNYHGMKDIAANDELLKRRLQQFRMDVAKAPETMKSEYEAAYAEALKSRQSDQPADIVKAVYPVVDRFYMDSRIFCANPLYDFDAKSSRRILPHNLAALYENLPPYKAILCANRDWTLGATPGLWVNNQDMTFDTRFMTAMPLLTALYVLPEFDYIKVGLYPAPLPMRYYTPASFSDPLIRKALDIGGIDVFTVREDEMKEPIPHTSPLQAQVSDAFNPGGFVSFNNLDSYGLAYLANHVAYADKGEIRGYETRLQHYFKAQKKNAADFQSIIKPLYEKLLSLRNMHDIILEADGLQYAASERDPGTVHINGIVGEKALFIADCRRPYCEMVFNASAAPGWHAYVNGQDTQIERANFAFIAVKVPQGQSRIWLVYEPFMQIFSDVISLLMLVGVGFAGRRLNITPGGTSI